MLKKFAVKNYKGFADKIEWDLSKHSNYAFSDFAIRDGIVKNAIIYGPNGVGKSNFSQAIFDIVYHLSRKHTTARHYSNYVHVGRPTNPVEFEYTFKFGSVTIDYKYSKDGKGKLLSEQMFVDGTEWFQRSQRQLWVDSDLFPIDPSAKGQWANSVNNASVVNFLLTSYPMAKDHPLILLQQFVESMLWFRCLDTREFTGLEDGVSNIEEYIIENNLLDSFSEFLEDVSGQHFEFVKAEPTHKHILCRIGGNTTLFWEIASTGTISLSLLYYWLNHKDKASLIVIDEFDAFYHFRLASTVCKSLFSLTCQVFLTSHDTYLMSNELLRPDCNFILNGKTIKPLNECTTKELRFGHNIEKMFRGNAFSV